jgi:integrase
LGVRPFKKIARDRWALPDEGKRLWAAFDVFEREQRINPNSIRALRALLLTGNREMEMCELEWAWIERGEIISNGMAVVVPDSKTGKITTPISRAFRGIPNSIDRLDGNPHVFASQRKAGAHIDVNHDQWQAILKEAKIEGLTIHDLRHTFATWAKSFAGLTKDEVGSLLNHAGCSVTDIYAKNVIERRLALAEIATACILDIVKRGNDAVATYLPNLPNVVKLDVMREKEAA